jgi:tetratricopeptide (TPR) repeat protein
MNLQERFKKANVARDNNQIEPALKEYEGIREKALEKGEKQLATDCLYMSGVALSQVEKYIEAQEYLQKAQEEFEKENNQLRVGAVLRDRSSIAAAQNNLDEAEAFMSQSVDLLSALESDEALEHLGMSKVKMGTIYAKQEKLEKAERIILEGIEDLEKLPDNFFKSTAYFNLAEVQKELGKKDQAKASLQKSLELLNSFAGEDEHKRRREKITELEKELSLP